MLVVLPIRGGRLPAGGAEVASEFGNDAVLLIGEEVVIAAEQLRGIAANVTCAEVGVFQPAAWSEALKGLISDQVVVLPGCPDGRDLGPRIAAAMGRQYFGSCVDLRHDSRGSVIQMARWGGLAMESVRATNAFVVSVIPGTHSIKTTTKDLVIEKISLPIMSSSDVEFVEELAPDASTMDLAEAKQIIGAGAGLRDQGVLNELSDVAVALDSTLGATRVVTDRGWVSHERQIGTTGVVVDPDLYVAFAVSGAVQHTSGLGQPKHIISVNTDPHCPMMQLADLAIVCDANDVITELSNRVVSK